MSKKTKKTIKLSSRYSDVEKLAIASDIIEYIRDRSASGKGPGGTHGLKWSGSKGRYSPSYASSIDFNIAGKGKLVNQELSGEMLTEMDVLKISSDGIEYGFVDGSDNEAKAEGNIIGSYGRSPNAAKARDFLKLTNNEVKEILKKYPLRGGEDASKKREKSTATRLAALAEISDFDIGELIDTSVLAKRLL